MTQRHLCCLAVHSGAERVESLSTELIGRQDELQASGDVGTGRPGEAAAVLGRAGQVLAVPGALIVRCLFTFKRWDLERGQGEG